MDRAKWVNKVMVLEKDPIAKLTNVKLVTHSDQFIKATKAMGVGQRAKVNEFMVLGKEWIAEFTNGKQSLVRYSKTCLKRLLKIDKTKIFNDKW